MPKVTEVLEKILEDHITGKDLGAVKVRKILAEVKRQIMVELVTSSVDSFSAHLLTQSGAAIEKLLTEWETSTVSEIDNLLKTSWKAGTEMLPMMSEAAGVHVGSFWISTHTLDVLKDFTFQKISGIKKEMVAKVKGELALGVLGQRTPQDVAKAIIGTLEGPSIFKTHELRAEIITKTEMGRAFSLATQKSMESAASVLPGLQKIWLHAGHPKQARIYHKNLHGTMIPTDAKFLVGNIGMLHPRDPTAPASEVINCGCTHVAHLAEWGTKEEFLDSWEKAQKSANSKRSKADRA